MNTSKKRSFRPSIETLEERAVPAATPFVTPHNGIIIPNVQVSTVYYGDAWNDASGPNYAELQAEKNDFNQYFSVLTNSPFMDGLGQYSGHPASLDPIYSFFNNHFPQASGLLPVYHPGHGQFVGSDTVAGSWSPNVNVTIGDFTAMLTQQFDTHALPQPTDNSLYVVYTPPNIQIAGGPAYHNSFVYNGHNVFFAAVSHVGNNQAWRPTNMTDFQAMTTISSHELVEAITDPILNKGYVDDTPPPAWSGPQEISDLGNGSLSQVPGFANYSQFALADGYIIQQYWSNQAGKAVGGAQINLTNANALVQTIPTMPNLNGAAFTLHGQPATIDMEFLNPVTVDSTHAKIPVIWGNRTDTHADVAIDGDRLDVTISGADNAVVFQGFMEAPGGDWQHHKELSGTVSTASTSVNSAEYVFGLQQRFHIYIPGDYDPGTVSAGPFGFGGDHGFNPGDFNPGPVSAGPFELREIFEVLPPGPLRDVFLDLRYLGRDGDHGMMDRMVLEDLFADLARLQSTTPTTGPTTPPTTPPPQINQSVDFM